MTIQRKRVAKRLASGLVAGALALGGLAISGGNVQAKTPATSRISGTDRYDTAVNIALELGSGNGSVIIASGENYADALVASSLAGGATPVLLTAANSLPGVVADYLSNTTNVDADADITIMGGESAVSAAVEAAIEEISADFTVARVEGATRYATALAAAAELGTSPTEIIVVSGTSPWDAMIASVLAAEGQVAILYAGPNGLDADTIAYIEDEVDDSLTDATIVGGPAAVPTSVYEQLAQAGIAPANMTLLYGADRYQTSVAVNEYLLGGVSFDGSKIALLRGDNWPDSLTAAPLMASQNRHAALVTPTSIPAATAGLLGALVTLDRGEPESVIAIGGTSAVSSGVLLGVKSASAELADPVGVITAAEGEASFTVTFLNINMHAAGAFNTHLTDESKYTVNGLGLDVFDGSGTAAAAATALVDADLDGTVDDTVVTVTLPAPGYAALEAGDTVALAALAEVAANDHGIPAVSATVADDSTAPTLTAVHKTEGVSVLLLASEELVDFDAADVSITAAGGCTAVVVVANAPAYIIGCDSDGNSLPDETLAEDDTITIALDGFSDVAGNDAGAASATQVITITAADATGPKAQAATITYEADGQVGFSIPTTDAGADTIDIVATAGGAADGFGGNVWRIVVQDSDLRVPSWSVDTATRRATITADFSAATGADILWALANDPAASAVFEDDSTSADALAAKLSVAFLSGDVVLPATAGTSEATLTITFDEAVYDGGAIAVSVGATAYGSVDADANTVTAVKGNLAAPVTAATAITITDVEDWTGNAASINSIKTP